MGGELFSSYPKNKNHVHKDQNYLLYAIITMVTNVSGGDTLFYDGIHVYDLGQRSHVLKHLHRRCIIGPFEKKFREGSLWR